jgi:NADH:ubiquinone oxidoreductase subunit 5 (subunit L)/multisubunit Na+/H+ antiporter MnhA subunit
MATRTNRTRARVVTVPLVLLAIPSILIGGSRWPVLFGSYFGDAIRCLEHPATTCGELGRAVPGLVGCTPSLTLPFWLALAGVVVAWFLYLKRPDMPASIRRARAAAPGARATSTTSTGSTRTSSRARRVGWVRCCGAAGDQA